MSVAGLVRTQYWNVSGPNPTPRTGLTSHAESRTDVEGYLLALDVARNAALLGSGVAAGLRVFAVAGQPGITVAPGVALDAAGRLVVLAEGGVAIVDPLVGPTGVQNIPTVAVTAPGPALDTTGLSGDLLVTVTWREVEDATDGLLVLRHAPWLRLVAAAAFVEDGLQVVLAKAAIGAGGVVDALGSESRRLVGVAAGRVELRLPRVSTELPLAVGQQPAGEVGLTGEGGLTVSLVSAAGAATQVLGTDAAASMLALLPAGGTVGIGLRGDAPQRTLHIEGSEVHSGGPGGGYSFADRDTGSFVPEPANGERWAWYAAGGAARLWSGTDQLTIRPQAGGVRVAAGAGGSTLELAGQDGNLGKLALGAGTIAARRADGTEPIVLDTANARVGIGTTAPANALHVTANSGLRQNRLYLSGNAGWSSLSYNAFHDDNNQSWIFPDPGRPAVTLEMDDAGGVPRFGLYTTTSADTQAWQLRLAVDGNTGRLSVPADLLVGAAGRFGGVVSVGAANPGAAVQVKSLTALDEGRTASGAWANLGSNAFYDGAWNRVDSTKAGVSLHMNADGDGQEFRFLRMESDGSKVRNIAVLGSSTSYILESKFGVGTPSPDLPLTVAAGARFNGVVAGADAPAVNYSFAYESIGVSNPAYNLRLQSPNSIIFHAGSNLPDGRASIDGAGNFTAGGNIGTSGRSPNPAHQDWGGGIHTWDVEAHGTIWCENDTISNGVMYSGRGFRTGTADVAELFDSAEAVEPGDVVCLDVGGDRIVASSVATDPAVLGVVSTAPGLTLNAANTAEGGRDGEHAVAVALCGRVPCKVSAENGPISRGNLLVASATPGHAMRASADNGQPPVGTVLGKALGRLDSGTGLIDILVALA